MSNNKQTEVKWLDDTCEVPPYGLAVKGENITFPDHIAKPFLKAKKAKLVNITVEPKEEK